MKTSAPNSRLVLVAAAISAIFLLLTASAQGETVGEGVASLTSTATDGASAEPAPAPAPPAEAPVEAQESESAIEPAGTTVESVTAAPSRVVAASEPVREATSEIARRASGAVSDLATTEPGATVAEGLASNLTDEVGRVAAKTAAEAGVRTRQLSEEAVEPPRGASPSPGERPVIPASLDKAPHTLGTDQPVGISLREQGGGASSSPASYSGLSGSGSPWLGALESFDGIGHQSAPASGTADARSNDPAPLDRPAPAPGSSAAAAGSAGSFFVPLAALLALLALAAPATLRRLGEVPAFRPPVPFVCALERPG